MSDMSEEQKQEKPRRRRDWRELLTELAIVVLGVGLALAAQQAVDWLQWRGKTAYASEQIQLELSNAMTWSMERIMVEDCIRGRLDELEQKLLASGERWTPVAPAGTAGMQQGLVLATPTRRWDAIAWTAAVADTSVTHFDRDKLTAYASLYGWVNTAREINLREFESVARLNILSLPVTLSADRRVELIEMIEAERINNRAMALNATRLLNGKFWQRIGLDPADARARVMKESTTYAACTAGNRP